MIYIHYISFQLYYYRFSKDYLYELYYMKEIMKKIIFHIIKSYDSMIL